ncbi:MAG: pilus assembly protein TadG-related protein [Janthinobacterium lividum]
MSATKFFPTGRRAFGDDRSGSVAVMTALTSGMLFGMAALTIDASRFYLAKRQQQTITDLAAVAAAANIANAQAAATANLVANNIPATSLASVELGTYVGDPTMAASQRFTAGGSSPNAARVTLRSTPSTVFGKFVGTQAATIGTRSIAVNANTAAFALGSTQASVNGGLANTILSKLTGSSISLQASDYASLASANVDLFGIANALALRINASGTYASLASTTVRLADVLNAAASALSASGGSATAVAALRTMATSIGVSGPSFAFGNLISFGPYGNLAIGSLPPISASLPVLPLISAAARINGAKIDITSGLNLAGLTIQSATLSMALGPAAPGSSYAAVGAVGTSLHTSQTRVLLTLQLLQLGIITGLNLPLYVETAPATATLSTMGCSATGPVDPAATLSVTPGVVDAWIGNVTSSALNDLTTAVNPGPAVLTNLAVTTISGLSHATISNSNPTSVPFTKADIAANAMKTTATTDYTSTLVSSLIGQLNTSATLLGTPMPMPYGSAVGITNLLQGALTPIDQALSSTLAMLGITIGDADTWVRAARCGQGALVN